MKEPILNPKQEAWREEVLEALSALRAALARLPEAREDEKAVQAAVERLRELFLLVVVGEFNSGKSAFLNALLGESLLAEGVVPTTTRIQILKHGETADRHLIDESTEVVTAPSPLLLELNVVDTPGTNAIDRQHEAITKEFIPNADLIFFVTSADRPFTESERAFLEQIREWGKNILIVVNKVDLIESAADVDRVEEYVRRNAMQLLGISPDVFLVTARSALRAKTSGDKRALTASRFEPLEKYVRETLDQDERIRLKLLNPLGVGERIVGKYEEGIAERFQLLQQDLATIAEIDKQLSIYEEDMRRDFRSRLAEVDNELHKLEQRGRDYIDDVVRLPRVFDLMNKDKMKADFISKVVAGAPEAVERRVGGIIDWLVSNDMQLWQTVKDQLARRRSNRSIEAVGEFASKFEYDRERLVETVGRTAQLTLDEYDREEEGRRMAESVQAAVANTALLEVGAVGLGTVVTLVATSTAVDITGVLAAGALATFGLLVIPQRRRAAKKELKAKIADLREQLMTALQNHFDEEIERSLRRLRDSLAPYTRFVRAEESSLGQRSQELTLVRQRITALRAEIS